MKHRHCEENEALQSGRNHRVRSSWRRCAAGVGTLGLVLGAPALADDAAPVPAVGLDKLLKLPDSHRVEAAVEERGGATSSEWRSRFQKAREDLDSTQRRLRETREELKKVAGEKNSWNIGAPGGGQNPDSMRDTPLDYRLSQEIRNLREEVERLKHRMTDLVVEANLAGVPEGWREPEVAAGARDATPGRLP